MFSNTEKTKFDLEDLKAEVLRLENEIIDIKRYIKITKTKGWDAGYLCPICKKHFFKKNDEDVESALKTIMEYWKSLG